MSSERLLSHIDTYSWVLSDSEQFRYVLRNFLKFCGFFGAF